MYVLKTLCGSRCPRLNSCFLCMRTANPRVFAVLQASWVEWLPKKQPHPRIIITVRLQCVNGCLTWCAGANSRWWAWAFQFPGGTVSVSIDNTPPILDIRQTATPHLRDVLKGVDGMRCLELKASLLFNAHFQPCSSWLLLVALSDTDALNVLQQG